MTSADNRGAAQQRADAIRVFRAELARLQDEGVTVLDDAQRRAVDTHHEQLLRQYAASWDIDRDARSSQLSLGMRVASFLGALALAASVFFLFYQFWGYLGTTTQVAILLGAAFAGGVATFVIRAYESNGYFTKLAAMVAFACFVLDITMLGQIFNITPSDKALLAWGAYALLLAYACDLRLLLVVGMLSLVAFISARVGTWCGLYWIDVGHRPENFFPAAVLLFLVPQYVDHARFHGFAMTYRVFALITLFLPMLVLSDWGDGSYLPVDHHAIEVFYQVSGFVLSALLVWLGVRRQWSDVVNTGTIFFVIFLYTRFFDWWWESMPKYLFFLVIGLVSILLLLVLRRLRTAATDRGEGGP